MRIHVSRLRVGPQIDMTPQGEFLEPPKPGIAEKLLRYGVIVAVLAGLAAMAALALWLALALIPVAIVAAAIAYAAFRWRMWKLSRSAGRNSTRPPFPL
jgi:predicted lysophospholipase L1 biosynthesis ABC-type transport system permease subunit